MWVVVSIHSVMQGYVVFIESLCIEFVTHMSYRLGVHLFMRSQATINISKLYESFMKMADILCVQMPCVAW